MKPSEAIQHIEAYNNTHAWEHNGWIYVDSMKWPRVFQAEVARIGGKNFEVMHTVEDCEENKMVLFGEESTGLVIGGRKTNCHVMRFKP